MEHLLELLNKVQTVAPLPIFQKDIVVVQNAGMQHWLNMSIANSRGISLNIDYALPAQFLWKLVRTVASKEKVPEQSLYSREVLCWRIYQLLQDKKLLADDDFTDVVNYFTNTTPHSDSTEIDGLKCYQLAVQLADLFEQYLVFRPDWLDSWQQQRFTLDEHEQSNGADTDFFDTTAATVKWQGKIWYWLQQSSAYNPKTLLNLACQHLEEVSALLPKRISFFGINAMAPMWLEFIHKISEHVDVHFFHLNPCADYWGDLKTEKQAFKQVHQWTEETSNELAQIGNPLLANLGQQGREFLSLLQQYSSYNIDVFSTIYHSDEKAQLSVLSAIQQDILTLHDTRREPVNRIDDSIVITSGHSALREVQGLHDWLLHQFNHDKTLTPKDVLVMCPQIEQYAPYVDAVFTRGWQDMASDVPPLPCSIADRVSKDSDPLVIAFIELLSLPDSRFQISQILGFIRIQAVQDKFSFSANDLEKLSHWLLRASVHWGLDAEHKSSILASSSQLQGAEFTWQQGLSRLLQGFSYQDQDAIFAEQLLIHDVEGSDAILLGQLMLVLEQLQQHAAMLTKTRTALQWQVYLLTLLDDCFGASGEYSSLDMIYNAISQLVEFTEHAEHTAPLPLSIVKEFLTQHFSQPDAGRQFMVGQVTFCSMLPMRSIPFKVIAVLGLNDGEFPRQRKPQAFDLMQQTPMRVGDRSRRGDDRYLFLEAIISARKQLYLSYQGRNIRNNNPQQASLVLTEFMAYLHEGYGWQFEQDHGQLRQLPMQAFSDKNYQEKWPSFDQNWLKLAVPNHQTSPITPLVIANKPSSTSDVISAEQVVNFLQHPAKYFATQVLGLNLNIKELSLDDAEPFEADGLSAYLARESFLDVYLDNELNDEDKDAALQALKQRLLLSGSLPHLPTTPDIIDGWQQNSETFYDHLSSFQLADIQWQQCEMHLPASLLSNAILSENGELTALTKLSLRLPMVGDNVVAYRLSSYKPKDLTLLALYQLAQQIGVTTLTGEPIVIKQVSGVFFDTKSGKVVRVNREPIVDAESYLSLLLALFEQGQQQALLLNASLGKKLLEVLKKSDVFEQEKFEQFWLEKSDFSPAFADEYIQYFWPKAPSISEHSELLQQVYQPIINGVRKIK